MNFDGLTPNEVEFYVEMAMEECQRWIEVATRELFLDHEDFLYSLRFGTQLRRLLNFCVPNCFDLDVHIPSTSSELFLNVGLSREHTLYVDDDDWILQFLLVCRYRLHFDEMNLFYAEDLLDREDTEQVFDQYLKSCPSQGQSVEDPTRRVCITVCTLARHLHLSNPLIPRFDYSATEPLEQFHSYIASKGLHNASLLFDRPHLDVVDCVKNMLDNVRKMSSTLVTTEGNHMDPAAYKVSRFLQDLGGEQTDTTDDYSCSSLSQSSCLDPSLHQIHHLNEDRLLKEQLNELASIPTRTQQRLASAPAADPLHYVSAHSAALAISEHAKQIISISEQQKRTRQQQLDSKPRFTEEESWISDLDTWRRKRKQKSVSGSDSTLEDESRSYQPAGLQAERRKSTERFNKVRGYL